MLADTDAFHVARKLKGRLRPQATVKAIFDDNFPSDPERDMIPTLPLTQTQAVLDQNSCGWKSGWVIRLGITNPRPASTIYTA